MRVTAVYGGGGGGGGGERETHLHVCRGDVLNALAVVDCCNRASFKTCCFDPLCRVKLPLVAKRLLSQTAQAYGF